MYSQRWGQLLELTLGSALRRSCYRNEEGSRCMIVERECQRVSRLDLGFNQLGEVFENAWTRDCILQT